MRVADLLTGEEPVWNRPFVRHLFNEEDATLILNTPLSSREPVTVGTIQEMKNSLSVRPTISLLGVSQNVIGISPQQVQTN